METENDASLNPLLRLYELQRESFNKRRDIEWKICVALWTAIVIGTGYFLVNKIYLDYTSGIIYLSILLVFCFLWLGAIHHSSEMDHNWMRVYKSRIEKQLGISTYEYNYQEPKRFIYLQSSWWWSQFLITMILLFSSWYLLTY